MAKEHFLMIKIRKKNVKKRVGQIYFPIRLPPQKTLVKNANNKIKYPVRFRIFEKIKHFSQKYGTSHGH